ncbi:MAG: hypothetical protein CM1200mP16_12110 [Nitrospina sp.]|nr:MAG: hypothetical protein CM1200mP16_12110 [Nitrospina sp.]
MIILMIKYPKIYPFTTKMEAERKKMSEGEAGVMRKNLLIINRYLIAI